MTTGGFQLFSRYLSIVEIYHSYIKYNLCFGGIGYITIDSKRKLAKWQVTNIKDLINIVFPHLLPFTECKSNRLSIMEAMCTINER